MCHWHVEYKVFQSLLTSKRAQSITTPFVNLPLASIAVRLLAVPFQPYDYGEPSFGFRVYKSGCSLFARRMSDGQKFRTSVVISVADTAVPCWTSHWVCRLQDICMFGTVTQSEPSVFYKLFQISRLLMGRLNGSWESSTLALSLYDI